MSLLLDALKKAAKDKKSADGAPEVLELSEITDSGSDDSGEGELEFSGDVNQQEENKADDIVDDKTGLSSPVNSALDQDDNTSSISPTVSDEALQVLVHKANKQHRAKQRLVWGGVISATLTILVTGGVYFYISMSDEVEAIERKHRIVMRTVTDTQLSRSVTEKIEQQKALEAKDAEQKVASEMAAQRVTIAEPKDQAAKKKIVVKKTITRDPVDILVNRAWKKYEEGEYDSAKSIYKKVLAREKNNRDALLGLAAIFVKQNDSTMAKSIYTDLVQLDPRDPVAVAALSNLETADINSLDESKLKLMIRRNSKAPHLHFALGNLYSQQKKWPEAQQSYLDAWQHDNNNADYAFNLAISLDQMGKQSEAVKFYQLSLDNAELSSAQFPLQAAETRLQQLSGGQ